MIGTLNEGPLHQALKALYARPGSREEVNIDGFVGDVVNGNQIVEIETRGFGALRKKKALNDPNFEIEVVLIEEEERRQYDGRRGRRKGGWVTTGRSLVRVLEVVTVGSMEDLFSRMAGELGRTFTSADLAHAMERPRSVGQKAAYCFRVTGLTRVSDKNGNELVYEKSE